MDAALDVTDGSAGCLPLPVFDGSPCGSPGLCTTSVVADKLLCDGGPCPTRAYPFGIAYDATYVYWAAQDGYNGDGTTGGIWRALRNGVQHASPDQLLSAVAPKWLVLDDDSLYFSARTGASSQGIFRIDLACAAACMAQALWTDTSGQIDQLVVLGHHDLLAVGDTTLVEVFETAGTWTNKTVRGAQDMAYAHAAYNGLAAYLYPGGPGNLTLDQITFFPAGSIVTPFADLSDAGLAAPSPNGIVAPLVADCTSVFTWGPAPNGIVKIPIATPGQPVDLATQSAFGGALYAIDQDESSVYVGEANGGGVWRIDKNGGAPFQLVASVSAWGIAVDETGVFYGEHGLPNMGGDGTIYRVAK